MDRLGYYGGVPRAPLLPIADEAKPEVESLVAAIRPAVEANT